MADLYSKTADYIMKEEGFRSSAYWDRNAYRIGFGSDTLTTSPSGAYRKVLQTDTTTRDMATLDLARRIKSEFEPKIRGQIGAQYYDRLPDTTKIALLSFSYNYGSIPKKAIIEAARTGDSEKIAKAIVDSTAEDNKTQSVKTQNALKNRRQGEASLILSAKETVRKTVAAAKNNPITTALITTALVISVYVLIKAIKSK